MKKFHLLIETIGKDKEKVKREFNKMENTRVKEIWTLDKDYL